jgi:hypothetical protein
MGGPVVILVPAENSVFLGNPDSVLDTREILHFLDRQCLRIADQIHLGKCLLAAYFGMHTSCNTRQIGEVRHQLPVFCAIGTCIGVQDKNHVMLPD